MTEETNLPNQNKAIGIQGFFAQLTPEPIAVEKNEEENFEQSLTQLLASTISQGLEDFKDKLQTKQAINSSNKALQASALIGRNVAIKGGKVHFELSRPVEGKIFTPKPVSQALVYVENAQLEIIRIIPLGDLAQGQTTFSWNGVDRNGREAPEGEYRFIVSAIGSSAVIELEVFTHHKVIKVGLDESSDDMKLTFENDQSMSLSSISEIELS